MRRASSRSTSVWGCIPAALNARTVVGKKNAAEPRTDASAATTAVEWADAYEELRRAALSGAASSGLSLMERQGMAAWMKISSPVMPNASMDSTPRIDSRQVRVVAQMLASVALVRLWEDELWKHD